jgi:hypothetical protein
MKYDKTEVFNIDGAFRGMRNPLQSYDKSDSKYCLLNEDIECGICNLHDNGCNMLMANSGVYILGENDLKLAQRLILAGGEHRKFLRMIQVCVDITAPLYWYKEFDTYKVGTTANSTSTMHRLATTPITLDCFEIGDFEDIVIEEIDGDLDYVSTTEFSAYVVMMLEKLRLKYLETNDKRYWKELIRWLPESWLQTRTVTMNYENLRNMYFQRRNHKLTEWSIDFVKWIESLPYTKELIMLEGK